MTPEEGCLLHDEGRLLHGAFHKTPSQSQTVATMEKESEILLAGVKLTCKHCGHDRFNSRNALLNTKVLTFFEFSRDTACYVPTER